MAPCWLLWLPLPWRRLLRQLPLGLQPQQVHLRLSSLRRHLAAAGRLGRGPGRSGRRWTNSSLVSLFSGE